MKRLSEIKVKKQSEVLTAEEMKKIVGGVDGVCYFMCVCTRGTGAPRYLKGDCYGPSDRNPECESGLQDCYLLGS